MFRVCNLLKSRNCRYYVKTSYSNRMVWLPVIGLVASSMIGLFIVNEVSAEDNLKQARQDSFATSLRKLIRKLINMDSIYIAGSTMLPKLEGMDELRKELAVETYSEPTPSFYHLGTNELVDSLDESIRRIKNPKHKFYYTPEQKRSIEYVKLMAEQGKESVHPLFPNDRHQLEAWKSMEESIPRFNNVLPKLIPPRVPSPFGRPFTVLIDSKVLWGKNGKRPGMDRFIATAFDYCEIIMFSDADEFGFNPAIKIDPIKQFITYNLLPQGTISSWPRFYWKSLAIVNRPVDSTLIIDSSTTNAFPNAENCVILREWDGVDPVDTSLYKLAEFIEFASKKCAANKIPVYEITPQFQDFEKDVVEIWNEKKKKQFF